MTDSSAHKLATPLLQFLSDLHEDPAQHVLAATVFHNSIALFQAAYVTGVVSWTSHRLIHDPSLT